MSGNNTGAGGYKWNIIAMDDGLNHLVDVTNCDDGTYGTPKYLFLKGYESGSYTEGYTYTKPNASNSISYYYDEEMATLYDEADLTFSASRFFQFHFLTLL